LFVSGIFVARTIRTPELLHACPRTLRGCRCHR